MAHGLPGSGSLSARAYFLRRLNDPTYWLVAILVSIFAVTAIWGVSPLPALSAVGFAGATVEWALLVRWRLLRVRIAKKFTISCGRALDHRQFAILLVVAVVTLAMDLWVSARTGGGTWDRGLSLFGISTLLAIWHAWSTPILAGESGLILGLDHVAWNEVEGVTFTQLERGIRVNVELRRDHAHYGRTIVGTTSIERAAMIADWAGTAVETNMVETAVTSPRKS
jgi:hypothetical protein